VFLDLLLDFLNGKVHIPEDKRVIALNSIDQFILAEQKRNFVPVKKVAQFLGKMEFLCIAETYLPPFLHRLRKDMISIVNKKSWNASMLINRGASKDLNIIKSILTTNAGNLFELETPLAIIVKEF